MTESNSNSERLNENKPAMPNNPTASAAEFVEETLKISQFEAYLWRAAAFVLKNQAEFALELRTSEYFVNGGESAISVYFISHHDKLIAEMLHCQRVNNVLYYVTGILKEVYVSKPEILRSNAQERLDFILRFQNMDELVDALAQKKVDELSYKGIDDLEKYFDDRLGVSLFQDDSTKDLIVEAIEIRNVIVHNRGKVSAIFKRRMPNYPLHEGDEINLTHEKMVSYADATFLFVRDLDSQINNKFGLPCVDESNE